MKRKVFATDVVNYLKNKRSLMSDQITIYSAVWRPDCKRAKRFFADHRIQ